MATQTHNRQILTLSEKAATQLAAIFAQSPEPLAGLRLSVTSKGCSGKSYKLDYVKQGQEPVGDEVVTHAGIKIFVDPAAVLYLIGTQMDFEENDIGQSFTFKNPNEKGRCGCGESFHI